LSGRALLVALLAGAAALQLGVGMPARRSRDEARAAFARARQQREQLRQEVLRLETRSAGAALQDPADAAAAARTLRRTLLQSTRGLPVKGIQIAVTPGQGGKAGGKGAANGRLVAAGTLPDVLRVSERLVQPAASFLLERVRLTDVRNQEAEVRLEVEGVRLGDLR
jgi:N-acetylmuramoyl-L-alanine amidase